MSSIPNVTRADGNAFIEALNARGLCACATIRQLITIGTPGPYLPCEYHADATMRASREVIRRNYYGK